MIVRVLKWCFLAVDLFLSLNYPFGLVHRISGTSAASSVWRPPSVDGILSLSQRSFLENFTSLFTTSFLLVYDLYQQAITLSIIVHLESIPLAPRPFFTPCGRICCHLFIHRTLSTGHFSLALKTRSVHTPLNEIRVQNAGLISSFTCFTILARTVLGIRRDFYHFLFHSSLTKLTRVLLMAEI